MIRPHSEIEIYNVVDVFPALSEQIAICNSPLAVQPTGATAAKAAGGSLVDDTYYYKISAIGYNGESLFSAEVNATTSATDNSIDLSWTSQDYVAEYRIYKGITTGIYSGYFRAYTNSFTDDGTKDFTEEIPINVVAAVNAGGNLIDDTYYYVITSLLENKESYPSAEVNATTATTNNSVQLTWRKVPYVSKYRIYRGTATGVYDRYIDAVESFIDIDDFLNHFPGIVPTTTSILTKEYGFIRKDEIKKVSGFFSPERYIGDRKKPVDAYVYITMNNETVTPINISKINNQSTWNTGTQAGVTQAVDDINSWL